MELHYLQEMCFIQFVETNQFMSILCCMVAFYIPVSIMSGLYIRVWWETVKRQRDLVHLQAGKKASSKRSDSSEEVDPVRQGENPDVACNRPSNGNRNSFNGRIRYLLQSCSSTEDPPGFQEEAQSPEGYTTPHSVGTRIHQDTPGYTTGYTTPHSVGAPHQVFQNQNIQIFPLASHLFPHLMKFLWR